MDGPVTPTGVSPKLLAASGIVKTGKGTCMLMLCSVSASLVVSLYDGTSTGGTKFIDSLPVDAKEEFDIPVQFSTGLYVEFVSGTGKVTVFYI